MSNIKIPMPAASFFQALAGKYFANSELGLTGSPTVEDFIMPYWLLLWMLLSKSDMTRKPSVDYSISLILNSPLKPDPRAICSLCQAQGLIQHLETATVWKIWENHLKNLEKMSQKNLLRSFRPHDKSHKNLMHAQPRRTSFGTPNMT